MQGGGSWQGELRSPMPQKEKSRIVHSDYSCSWWFRIFILQKWCGWLLNSLMLTTVASLGCGLDLSFRNRILVSGEVKFFLFPLPSFSPDSDRWGFRSLEDRLMGIFLVQRTRFFVFFLIRFISSHTVLLISDFSNPLCSLEMTVLGVWW